MLTTTSYPVAPTTEAAKSRLLDVATVQDTGFAWQNALAMYESYNCMKFGQAATFCSTPTKTFDQASVWQDGFIFAAYGGVTCKAIGLDMAHMESETRRVFEAGESTAVERAMMATRFIANASGAGIPGAWTAPVDVTPTAGAVKPAVGVALLEGYAANNYVGVPTLHMPTVIGSLLLGVPGNVFDGQVAETALGSKIAIGAGYDFPNTSPTGAAAATGEKWIYATGEVLVIRGEAILRQEMDYNTNVVSVLAERPYIVAVDCFTAGVRVQVTT